MCGIIGSCGGGGQIHWSEAWSEGIAHRGPDARGIYKDDNAKVFLGHTRLSVLDLSEKAAQPMTNPDGNLVITFNGEIYNHIEIRKKLVRKGYHFNSTGDTETLLYAYEEYGLGVLEMLNGIFAFCIFDRNTQEIILARDQMGVKPLYYSEGDSYLAFASELKCLLHLVENKQLNYRALSAYLTYLYSPGEQTPLTHVKKLLPGHYLKFQLTNLSMELTKYYQIPFRGKYLQLDEDELISQLDDMLVHAVRRQMLADLPVGFFLSGGLDSSLIVAIARKLFPNQSFPCFTIDARFGESSEGFADDLPYAVQVANHLNVDLTIIQSDPDILRDFDKMIWYLDEPQADPAPIHVLSIARGARQKGIKVLLGGVGGDDLFSGYRRHQALRFEGLLERTPLLLRKAIKSAANLLPRTGSVGRRLQKILAYADQRQDLRMAGYFSWFPFEKLTSLFAHHHRQTIALNPPLSHLLNLKKEIPEENDLLNMMLYWEMKTFLADHNLNYTDKMAMAVGVEARVPFLDTDLVNFSATIPPKFKMKGGETKYILKRVAERYLPKEIIYRDKTGFGAPVREWIKNDLNHLISDYLSPEQVRQRGIFQPDAISRLITENKENRIDAAYTIWSLLAIESWMRQFIDRQ